MKLKDNFFYTIRENVKDEDSVSGNLLVRSGMIKKSSSGVYMFLPLGYRVLKNIENIIREEMNNAGATELLMPGLITESLFEESGRRENFGSSIFTLKDRYNKPYALGPTHEEMFVLASLSRVKSYKDLPFNLYQIQTKFRDEARPRYGLIRVREFIMKDAYSFDKDYEGLDISYQKMFDAYKKIFDRLNIEYKIVKADTGTMGGILSEEFQAVTDIGEDILVLCDSCEYASNLEVTECINKNIEDENIQEIEEIYTPNCKTIKELSDLLNISETKLVKALMFNIDNEVVVCFIRGDREVNLTKLSKLLNSVNIEMATEEEILSVNAYPGYTGPINLKSRIIIDDALLNMKNFVVGANKESYHLKNVNLKDFKYDIASDIVNVVEKDICPCCGSRLYFKKGIEIGNTFKLGDKYSNSLGLKYLDENNKLNPVIMGCYGIGLGRIMASIIEQNNDEKGIIWPSIIAPYKVALVLLNDSGITYANELYDELNNAGISTLLDDRDERAGVKFNDMDLIGIPIRITIGKSYSEGLVEFKLRKNSDSENIEIAKLIDKIRETI